MLRSISITGVVIRLLSLQQPPHQDDVAPVVRSCSEFYILTFIEYQPVQKTTLRRIA
jgi:hypothetical protein